MHYDSLSWVLSEEYKLTSFGIMYLDENSNSIGFDNVEPASVRGFGGLTKQ